jgi:hypothetical protein
MQIALTVHPSGSAPAMTMTGVERYAFRTEIDRATGALRHAATTSDDLDLRIRMPNVPSDKSPRVVIWREVAIERRE